MRASWSDWLERLSGAALLVMLALTVVDVLGRYIFARPVAGVIELIQYAMVVVVFAALPAVTRRRQHISVGVLEGSLGRTSRRIQQTLVASASAIVLASLAWTLLETAGSMHEQGDVIGYLRLPTFVAAYLMSAMSLLTAGVSAFSAMQAWMEREPPSART